MAFRRPIARGLAFSLFELFIFQQLKPEKIQVWKNTIATRNKIFSSGPTCFLQYQLLHAVQLLPYVAEKACTHRVSKKTRDFLWQKKMEKSTNKIISQQ